MNQKINQSILLFLLSITSVFSQTFTYDLGVEDEKLIRHYIAKEKISLNNGDIILRKGEAIVDIFKQNQYPQQLVRVSKNNLLRQVRDIKDTIIFKVTQLGNRPNLFFTDASGKLKFVNLNPQNLSNESSATTLLQLSSKKAKPKKINDYIFPEIYFSKDSTKFAILQPLIKEKKLAFNVQVFDQKLQSIYKETVQTSFNSSYFFKLKSALLTNDGKLLFTGTDNKNVLTVFSVNNGDIKKYTDNNQADKKFQTYSDIFINNNGNYFFYTYVVSRKNALNKLKYKLLDDNLDVLKNKEEDINLTSLPSATGSVSTFKLLFKNFKTLDNGEHILVAEYATPLPEPTMLGVLLIQKLNTGYIFSGPIVAIHLNNDMSIKSSKLITKFKRPNMRLNGHHFMVSNNIAHFLFYDSPNNNTANLVDFQWNLNNESTDQKIILKHKDISKVRFDLNGGFTMNQKQVMLSGILKKRLLLTLE